MQLFRCGKGCTCLPLVGDAVVKQILIAAATKTLDAQLAGIDGAAWYWDSGVMYRTESRKLNLAKWKPHRT